jgi:hypothetical protein
MFSMKSQLTLFMGMIPVDRKMEKVDEGVEREATPDYNKSSHNEIFNAVKEVFPEVMKYLEEKHPELVPLYEQRYNYAMDEHYPFIMRLHNAYEILRVYMVIRRERK